MSRKTVTFRSQTMGSISDLISDEGLICHGSQSILSSLAGELLQYRDEGVELAPTVLFCTDAIAVFAGFPGSVRHLIGAAPLRAESVKRILKDCAPLAARSWCIFMERTDSDSVNYGVFNYIASPTTIPLHEAIGMSSTSTCLLLRKTSTNTIEVLGSKGSQLLLGFSTIREEDTQAIDPIKLFADDCSSTVPPGPFSNDFCTYLWRLMDDGLSRCHGTILVCAVKESLGEMEALKDGIQIQPKLDFFSAYSNYRTDGTADSILRLQSAEELLRGIFQCDGIVVFDTRGSLIAYRVFYRGGGADLAGLNAPVGGARRRAFEGTRAMIGGILKSSLFRSQDGLTIREGGQ